MSYWTDFDPANIGGSGLQLTAGTHRKTLLRQIANYIKGFGSTRWDEVTASSPTPTALQPYASTIGDPATEDTTYGATDHVTLYDTQDPGLSLGTPSARMLRFAVGTYGIVGLVTDAVLPGNGWLPLQGSVGPTYTTTAPYYYFVASHVDYDTAGWQNTYYLVNDIAMHVFEDDNWMIVQNFIKGQSQPVGQSGAGIYMPTPPTDGSQTRTSIPHIYSWNPGNGWMGDYTSIRFWQPQADGYTLSASHEFRTWGNRSTDNQGRYPFVPAHFFHSNKSFNPADGWLSNYWVGLSTAVPSDNNYHVLTIGGSDYLAFRTMSNTGYIALVPTFNVA